MASSHNLDKMASSSEVVSDHSHSDESLDSSSSHSISMEESCEESDESENKLFTSGYTREPEYSNEANS